MARVQGEGDYEAARRYRARTERFVRAASEPGVRRSARAEKAPRGLTEAEASVRRRAKAGDQDRRDAAVFRQKAGTPRPRSR